ncbi:Hypothetical predicted protein [Marmota monax]|uniref:Uncharacterized protein n=1 Tax=Marmota monax TaxID=9995 RepID=A0A5E4B1J3_MARMO|nr:hypothetical protein GHT09_009508 [Marmota monax]VTJ63010.1 Hypothetical predicted protein [Marmota monax]
MRPTEGQPQDKDQVDQGQEGATCPGSHHQSDADSPAHDGRISKGLADGHIPIIGHHHQEETFSVSKSQKEKGLGHAAPEGDGQGGVQEVQQHPGHCVAGIGDVHYGQVGEEEVHGGVQSGVQAAESQDGPIPQQSEGIEEGENSKKNYMNPLAKTKSQEDELCDHCLIFLHFSIKENVR